MSMLAQANVKGLIGEPPPAIRAVHPPISLQLWLSAHAAPAVAGSVLPKNRAVRFTLHTAREFQELYRRVREGTTDGIIV